MSRRTYYVYILSSNSRVLYTGVTNHLQRRVSQHRFGIAGVFTKKYKVDRLVYYETFGNIKDAIAREKQIKGYRREKKIQLIESMNPHWEDLVTF